MYLIWAWNEGVELNLNLKIFDNRGHSDELAIDGGTTAGFGELFW